MAPSPPGLDETVFPLRERLRAAGVEDPRVLFLMATGVGFLPSRMENAQEIGLGELLPDGDPRSSSLERHHPWSGQVLHAGRLGGLAAWCLEDVSGEPLEPAPSAPWLRALPVWLAAAAGACVCVHTSAGSALANGAAPVLKRGLGLVSDHLNVSGSTPLLGLGESKLGPLFPDLTRLHHVGLRRSALARAAELGIDAAEVVAACTSGPALETPAERVMLARLGAEVSVPGLATPLLAAGHAGLAALAIVAVTDAGDDGPAVRQVLAAAAELVPALEDLLLALVPDLVSAVQALSLESA